MLYTFEGCLKKFSFKTKNYTLNDTNLSSRQMNYYEEKGLLLSKHEQYFTHRFSLRDIIWLRLVSRFREFTLSLETIKEIKEELFKETKLSEYILDPDFDDYLDIALDSTDLTELEKSEIKSAEKFEKKNLFLPINYFDVIINQLIDSKNRISLIIAVKKDLESTQIDRSASSYWLTLFSPDKIEQHSKQKDYFEIFSHDHISISMNDLLQDVILNIDYKKLPKNLVQLTDSEQLLVDYIRSGQYKSISVRFNDNRKPYLAELTEIRKLKKEARLYEIIYKGAYQEIEIKTQEGEIYSFKSTKKVKI